MEETWRFTVYAKVSIFRLDSSNYYRGAIMLYLPSSMYNSCAEEQKGKEKGRKKERKKEKRAGRTGFLLKISL